MTLKVTQLVGIVSLMYGMLLHADAPARGDNPPPPLPQHTLTISTMGFRMLNHIAQLDLQLLQVIILHRAFKRTTNVSDRFLFYFIVLAQKKKKFLFLFMTSLLVMVYSPTGRLYAYLHMDL